MSKRIFLEFECPEGHRSEKLTHAETQEIYCPECDNIAQRVVSVPRFKLEGVSGDFPTAADRWARVHEEANRKARKRTEGRTQYDD